MNDVWQSHISYIHSFQGKHDGYVNFDDKVVSAELEVETDTIIIRIATRIDLNVDQVQLVFTENTGRVMFLNAIITSNKNSIQIKEKRYLEYSEGKVYSISSANWSPLPYYHISYFKATTRILYDAFNTTHSIEMDILGILVSLVNYDSYLIIESKSPVSDEKFSEIQYNILIALGFITGHFVQDIKYVFQKNSDNENYTSEFSFQKLRKGHKSIYHPITWNPFGYDFLLGESESRRLYENNILSPFTNDAFSKLILLCLNESQIQYALVLFNESNSNENSLLIKNNCFFIVIEILRKFFYEKFKQDLPNEYSQKGNVEKSLLVFESIVNITDSERLLIKKRNDFMHGDIKDIEGDEMVEIMQKQITFIYKLLLSFVGFDGYIIDHYAIRNSQINSAFIKLGKVKI